MHAHNLAHATQAGEYEYIPGEGTGTQQQQQEQRQCRRQVWANLKPFYSTVSPSSAKKQQHYAAMGDADGGTSAAAARSSSAAATTAPAAAPRQPRAATAGSAAPCKPFLPVGARGGGWGVPAYVERADAGTRKTKQAVAGAGLQEKGKRCGRPDWRPGSSARKAVATPSIVAHPLNLG